MKTCYPFLKRQPWQRGSMFQSPLHLSATKILIDETIGSETCFKKTQSSKSDVDMEGLGSAWVDNSGVGANYLVVHSIVLCVCGILQINV